jgi:hypothetical protein
MHMSVLRVDQAVSLCIVCFGALARAICQASKKLSSNFKRNLEQRNQLLSR